MIYVCAVCLMTCNDEKPRRFHLVWSTHCTESINGFPICPKCCAEKLKPSTWDGLFDTETIEPTPVTPSQLSFFYTVKGK